MKSTLTIFLSLLFSINNYAQRVGFDWAEKAFINSSSAKLQGTAILVDSDKNVYLFGIHASSNNANFKNKDMILAKYDSLGKKLWYKKYPTRTFPGHGTYKMHWDKNYNIVVAGEMNTIFGTDTIHKYTSSLNATIGIVKFDINGNYIWSTQVDADVDDDYDFVQLPNGNYAIKGEGTVTYKPGSTLSLTKRDFIAFIDSSGTVLMAKEAPYNAFASLGGLGVGVPRKIFANGNNLASVMAVLISNSPAPGSTPNIVFDEIDWSSGSSINQIRIKYSGIGIFDYQFDSMNRMLFLFTNTSNDNPTLNGDTSIKTTSGTDLIIQYDLDGDSVVNYQNFDNTIQISHNKFSYQHGLTVVYNYRDSIKNLTLDSTYYELSNVAPGFEGQNQYLLVNFNGHLDYNYYTQYGTSNGSLSLFDLTHDMDGNIYGTTDGSSESYFDMLKQGTLGNSDATGFIFKVGDTSRVIIPVSIANFNHKNNTFTLFPNPTKDQITISFSETVLEPYTLSILNSLGKVVRQTELRDQSANFDLSKLEKGVYFVHLVNSKGSKTVKLLKH